MDAPAGNEAGNPVTLLANRFLGFAAIEPYRVMFPLGAAYAVAGSLPWIAHGLGLGAYPAALHRTWMMEGFELCFVVGFLLTSLPAFTRGERCRAWELHAAVGAALCVGAGGLAGFPPVAHGGFVASVVLLAVAAGRRVLGASLRPAEEFGFVGLGLLLAFAGGTLQLAAAAGAWTDPAPNFASRLISLGMMLSIVMGVGSLLVPTFIGIRDPLVIPGIAAAHERGGRRVLYGAVALSLVSAFALEALGRPAAGAWLRAAAAAVMILWVWKLWRRPAHATVPAWTMWASGWFILLGLLIAAAVPRHTVAGLHVAFIGGYGLLTLAIASRVVISHGRRPASEEARLVRGPIVGLFAGALILRVVVDAIPGRAAPHALAAAAVLWISGWLWWTWGMLPRVFAPAASQGGSPPLHHLPPGEESSRQSPAVRRTFRHSENR